LNQNSIVKLKFSVKEIWNDIEGLFSEGQNLYPLPKLSRDRIWKLFVEYDSKGTDDAIGPVSADDGGGELNRAKALDGLCVHLMAGVY